MNLLKDRRIQFYLVCILLLGALPILFKGINFGMDFKGGTSIQIKLDKKLSGVEMQPVVTVLQTRLNSYGLKDIAVKPWGNEYVIIEIAETDPKSINQLQALLGQQGKFEALFKGQVVLTGQDILSVITDPQKGYGAHKGAGPTDYEWSVPFLLSGDASSRFAAAVAGQCTQTANDQCTEQVFMFIDRPENAVILMDSGLREEEKDVPIDFDKSSSTIPIDDLVANSGATLVVSDTLTDNVLKQIQNKTVVFQNGAFNSTLLSKYSSKVLEKPKTGKYWIQSALNLETIVHLTPSVTAGTPVTTPSITGHAESVQEAVQDLNRLVILLKSGRLPVAVSIGGVSTISPTLGADFLYYTGVAALLSLFAVTLILYVRYRKIKTTTLIMWTCFSEIFMILGISALIGWQLDLPSIAGIIAAIGTGVNDQIIIIDEVLRKEQEELGQSIAQKIKRAFSIIFMAAGTIIFAMVPLLIVGMGALRGFAITTIIGVIVGISITRPAYAAVVQRE